MKKVLIYVLVFLCSGYSVAQKTVLEEDLRDSTVDNFGPNQKHFVASYIHIGGAVQYDDGTPRYDLERFSSDFSFGAHYRYKLTSFLGIGAIAGISFSQFFVDADSVYTNEVNRYRQTYNGLEGGVFARISLGRRGDFRGFYIDAGIKGQVNYFSQDMLYMDSDVANKSFLLLRYPDAVNTTFHSAFMHVNYNRIGLYANYRLSELRSDFLVTPLTVGVRFDL